jgi:hypothetical protein
LTAEEVCAACGERNPPNSAFCVFCGTYLGWDEREADEETTRVIAPPIPEPPERSMYGPSSPTVGPPPVEPVTSRMDEVPTDAQPLAPSPGETEAALCPACGTPTEANRRFCGKCGQPLRPAHLRAPSEVSATQVPSLWQRIRDPAARRSRGAYRRSLPWWRRWRRVAFGTIALILVGGSVFAIRSDGINRVKDFLNGSTTPSKTTSSTKTPTKSTDPPELLRPYPGHSLSIAIRGKYRQDVTRVQQRLKDLGYTLAVDGDFGPQTKGVVHQYQADHKLQATGIVDRDTWARLFAR